MSVLKILIDTKEKKSNYRSQLVRIQFEKLGYEVIQTHIESADYSFELNGVDYRTKIAIERKSGNPLNGGGFEELKNNLFEFKKSTSSDPRTGYGIRLSDEFDRLCENKTEIYLLIENAINRDALKLCPVHCTQKRAYHSNGEFESRLTDFLNGVNRKRKLYGLNPVKVVYCRNENTAKTIIEIFENYLKNGKS